MYQFLNIFFFIFHTIIVLYNSLGWIFKKTRKTNFILLLMTSFSWFIVGLWYGLGYCFCTDWHYQVKIALGTNPADLPYSYIKLLIDTVFGSNVNEVTVNWGTIIVFVLAIVMSIVFNIQDWKNLRKHYLMKQSDCFYKKYPTPFQGGNLFLKKLGDFFKYIFYFKKK